MTELLKFVDIFNNPNPLQDCVAAVGEQFIVHLYGGTRQNQILEICPNHWYKTSKLRHESCEPSSYSTFTRQHSLRVYHKVQLKIGAGPSNRDNTSLSRPLRQTPCCISYVVGAKETAFEIVGASEAG
ncbi:hypothetical protein PR048_021594 [Dryococelus australis]|uniref:Uncharacterized protein n=1 Tax=Dryococelus australis TaxID=614101 RepID=A0ABQ9GYM0_9NEOP|nr:hypothetical protein PR048_021594 [Dryococelus australis]